MKEWFDKIREYLFNKKCPNVRCETCEYFYRDHNHVRRCSLADKYMY